jgi:hypothetical protein
MDVIYLHFNCAHRFGVTCHASVHLGANNDMAIRITVVERTYPFLVNWRKKENKLKNYWMDEVNIWEVRIERVLPVKVTKRI